MKKDRQPVIQMDFSFMAAENDPWQCPQHILKLMLLNISTHSLHICFGSALWGTFIRLYFHNFGTHILRRLPANLQVVKTRTAQSFPRRRVCVYVCVCVSFQTPIVLANPSHHVAWYSPVSESFHLRPQSTHLRNGSLCRQSVRRDTCTDSLLTSLIRGSSIFKAFPSGYATA